VEGSHVDDHLRRMLKFKLFIVAFLIFMYGWAPCQTLEKLEVIWRKTMPLEEMMVFGWSISRAGDVNGDGFEDVLVGARPESLEEPYRGKAYLFFGGNPMDTVADMVFTGKTPDDLFGIVSTCGDINVDGYSDIMVGAMHSNRFWGAVYVYFGGQGMDTVPDLLLAGPSLESYFGYSLTYLGDVNGDGYDDFGVGAGAYNEVRGRVYIYFGGPAVDTVADVVLEGGHGGDHEGFGYSVGGGKDVNGDGFDDVLVGAPAWGPSFWGEGRIYVYYGGNPMDDIADVWMDGEGPNQTLGWMGISHTYGGNLDPYADVVAGTAYWPWGFPWVGPGKLYILFGGAEMDGVPDVWMVGRTDSSGLGKGLSGSGKIDGEYDGVLGGAPHEYGGSGTAYLWLGGTPLDTIPDAWMRGEGSEREPGWNVADAGDVDGDGVGEILISNYAVVGAPWTVWICKYGWGIGEVESLKARAGDSLVVLRWNPEPTPKTLGYEILRSTNQDTLTWIRLNDEPIYPESSRFVDREVRNGVTYYYWLRVLGNTGLSRVHGPVQASPQALLISSFTVTDGDGRYVVVEWNTSQEPDFLGWNIYRCQDCACPEPTHRRNGALIPPGSFDYRWTDNGVEDATTYHYWLGAMDLVDEEHLFGPRDITTASFSLLQNVPNPFGESTTIQYSLSWNGHTTLTIYDCIGRAVRTLVNTRQERGRYVEIWDGRDERGDRVSSGIYYYRLQQGKSFASRKMILMK